jgi:restriction system protein
MALWMIRAGKHGEDESTALEKGLAIVGWQEMPDVKSVSTWEALKAKHARLNPDMSTNGNTNSAAQLWAFANKVQKNDLVVLPLKTRSVIAIGKIVGDYVYLRGRHTRKVEWLKDDIPRNKFGQDLLYSFGAFMTICRITRNDAEQRVKAVLAGKTDPYFIPKGIMEKAQQGSDAVIEEEDGIVDLEEQGFDQIRLLLQSKFAGHNLARLIEAILKVQGYQTYRSPEGPDGGVDILAGYGVMGFDRPRLCVQVKSGGVQTDSAVRELEGVMSRVNAEQGLFVAWDGFNKTVMRNIKGHFFKVRLWDDKQLITNLLSTYEKLPDEIQAELPLKRIWVVVPGDD